MNCKTSPRKLSQTQDGDSSGGRRDGKAVRGGQRGWRSGRERRRVSVTIAQAQDREGSHLCTVQAAAAGRPSSSPLPVVGKPGAEGTTNSPRLCLLWKYLEGFANHGGTSRASCSVAQGTCFEVQGRCPSAPPGLPVGLVGALSTP